MSGIEFSSQAVRRCIEKGFDVVEGFIDGPDAAIRGEKFSACFMFNFWSIFLILAHPQGNSGESK